MEEECMIVDEVGKKGTGSPPLKKLKQSRLPFAPLDSKTPQKNSSPTTQKKRKLSGSDLSQNSPKTPRSENNSLNETPVSEKKLQTPKSAGSTNKPKTGDKLTPESTKKRGRGRPRKSLESKEVAQKSQKSSHPGTSDDEVSSSVDDDVDVPEPKKKPIEKTRKLLSSFLCKEPTQQAEVTTSTDLNDKEDIEQDDKENQTCKESEATKGEMEISSKGEESEEKTSNNESEEKEETGKKQLSVVAMLKTNKAGSEAEKEENEEGKSPKLLDKGKAVEKQAEKTTEGKNKVKGNVLKKKVNIGKEKVPKKKDEKNKRKSEVKEKLLSDKIDKTDEKENPNNEVEEEPKHNTNEGKEKVEPKQSVDEKKLKKESEEKAAEELTSKEKNQIPEKESDLKENDAEIEAKNEKEGCDHEANTEPNNDKKEDKTPEKHDKNSCNEEEEMEVDDLDTSGSSKSDGTGSANTSPSSVSKPNNNLEVPKPSGSTPSTPSTPSSLAMKAKKLTPKQQAKEAERQQKREERERLRQEKEKKKQEEQAEKERLKKIKEEEKQKAKEEKEKAKEEQKRKKQEEIEAKRLKKEEEQQLKELEKMIREEEERQAEEEKQQKKDKLKNKFASFFVAKKKEPEENEENNSSGNFKEFRVKEDMQLAPLVRTVFTDERKANLTDHIASQIVDVKETYLNVLRAGSYTPTTTERTWPVQKKKEENDIEIIEDDDEEVGAGDSLVQGPESGIQSKNVKAKLLHFCENRRPAYWGTWSKKSNNITARKPFAKDEIFNYEYDSDDDWEEEETGESLSDSEGEEKEEEEGDQYEVDNDFFVPHGYLSDDEGKSDEEEEAGDKEQVEDDGIKSKERLKQKQAEFEEEMKKKTKHLKPRVIGSLWMADANENPAFKQLMKILNPYKAVTLGTRLPIGTHYGGVIPKDTKDMKDDDDGSVEDKGNGKKFCKTFPEEAVPALIKLLHGNRHGKIFLSREFSDFWRKFQAGELEEEELDHIPKLTSPVQASMFIAKKKVESKIQELGHWRKCPDEGPYHKVLMWYVPKHVREEYGVEDITVPSSWNYINKPKEKREVCFDDPDTTEENKKDNKAGKLMPITAFTKKLPATPSSSTTSPTSTPTTPQMLKSSEASPASGSPAAVTPSHGAGSISSNTGDTPSGKSGTPGQPKKKVALFSVPRNQEITDAQKASFVSFFKKNVEKSADTKSESLNEKTSDEKISPSDQNDDSIQCITLD